MPASLTLVVSRFSFGRAVTGRDPGADLLANDIPVDPATAAHLRELVDRRTAGEPLAYVTGTIGFRHLSLLSDRRALIPRPETEGLVEVALERVRGGVAADVGTGTGAIALALRQEGLFSGVIGIDLSPAALDLARLNAGRTGLAVTWLEGDLLAPLGELQVDLLVSNPPYLTGRSISRAIDRCEIMSRRWRWSPAAMGCGQRGRLLTDGRQAVVPGGWIALEVDCRSRRRGGVPCRASWAGMRSRCSTTSLGARGMSGRSRGARND